MSSRMCGALRFAVISCVSHAKYMSFIWPYAFCCLADITKAKGKNIFFNSCICLFAALVVPWKLSMLCPVVMHDEAPLLSCCRLEA